MADETWTTSYLDEIGVTGEVKLQESPCAPPASAAPAKASSAAPKPAAKPAAAKAKVEAAENKKDSKKDKKAEAKAAPAPAPGAPPPKELSPEELAKLSKEERKAYHQARRAVQTSGEANKPAAAELTKAQRRAVQEAQRKAKEDQKQASVDNEELLKDLKLQGLSEDQAREVMKEILAENAAADAEDDDDDGEVEDLMGSVRRWIDEQKNEKISKESIRDFNMKVRFQGHVDSTPPDHLRCIFAALIQEACVDCDLAAPKLQPGAVAKKVQPVVEKWAPLLEALFNKIGDALEGADAVVQGISAGVASTKADVPDAGLACGLVGSLMAVREVEVMEDEDLLAGCRRAEIQGKVMEKFIEFLEDALDDDDDEESD